MKLRSTGFCCVTLLILVAMSGSKAHGVTFPININPGAYTGQYNVDTSVPPHFTGPATVNLAPGDHILFINPISTGFTVGADGQITRTRNPTALSISGNTISFNTTSVIVDPGAYDGVYNLYSIPGPIAGNFTGRQSFTMVAGINLYLQVGGNGNTTINCQLDATGQLSNVNNPVAARVSGNVLSFNNTTINVDPGTYTGWYFPNIYVFRNFTGSHSFVVVPGLDFSIDNGLFDGNSAFTSVPDSSGQLTIQRNSPAATASGSTLVFNNTSLVIDPGLYTGVMSISAYNIGGFFGQHTFVLLPGLDYGLDNGFGLNEQLIFTLDGSGNVSRTNLTAAASFTGNILHLQTAPIVIEPGNYDGPFPLTSFNGFGFRGRQLFQFIPQMRYGVDGGDFLGPLPNGYAFSFDVDANGQVTNISNPVAAQSNANTLLLSCAGIHIDPTTYNGVYRIGLVFSLSGLEDINLIDGLTKVLFGSDNGPVVGNFAPIGGGVVPSSLTATVGNQAYNFQFRAQACVSRATPTVSLSPGSLGFAGQDIGSTSAAQSITLTNTGNGVLTITGVTTSGDFSLSNNTCGSSVTAGSSCSLAIAFTPIAAGPRPGTLTITDNAAGSPHTVSLAGTGTKRLPIINWPSPQPVSYGTALTGAQLNASASAGGSDVPGTFTYTPPVGTVLGAGSHNLSVSFVPADTGTFTPAAANVLINVSPALLTVSGPGISRPFGFPNPALAASYSGFVNGDTVQTAITGSPILSMTASTLSPVGSYPVIVELGTLSAANYTFKLVNGTLSVALASSTTTLDSSSQPAQVGQSVSFKATVNPAGAGTPTGTVTLKDGAAILGQNTLASGQTTFTNSVLGVGSHSITAIYTGDNNFSGSSKNITQDITYRICPVIKDRDEKDEDEGDTTEHGPVLPIRLRLCDVNGVDLSSSAIVVHATQITSASGFSAPPSSPGNPGNNFRFENHGYLFRLRTRGLAAGIYSLQFTVHGDPVTHAVSFRIRQEEE